MPRWRARPPASHRPPGSPGLMTRSFSVVVTDHPWASVEAEQDVLAGVGAEMHFAGSGGEAELLSLVEEADAILTCFAQVTPAVVRAAARLQVIGRYGIGVDNIAVDEATRLGVLVTNVPTYCQDEVTDHALALLLTFARGLHTFDRGVRAGDWSLGQIAQPLRRLRGQTLGHRRPGPDRQASGREGFGVGAAGDCPQPEARPRPGRRIRHRARVAQGACRALGLREPARSADRGDHRPDRRGAPAGDEGDGVPDQHRQGRRRRPGR